MHTREGKIAVSLAEAAEMLSVSTFTVRRHILANKLKVARIGRRLVIPVSEIKKILYPNGDGPLEHSGMQQ